MKAVANLLGQPLCVFLVLAWLGCGVAEAAKKAECQTKDGLTLFQVLEQTTETRTFAALIRQAGLVKHFNDKSLQATLLVPMDYAFGNLLPKDKGFFDVFPGVEIPTTIINYHVALPAIPPDKMVAGTLFTTALNITKTEGLKLNITKSADPIKPFIAEGATNTANITKLPGRPLGFVACNSVVYFMDGVLLPAEKMVPSEKPRVSVAAAEKATKIFRPVFTSIQSEEDTTGK